MHKHPITIAREMRGLSQVALAEALGTSKQMINGWERGQRSPGAGNTAALAIALDVDESWIAGHPAMIPVPDHTEGDVLQLPVIRTEAISGYGTLYIVRVDAELTTQNLAVIVGDGLTLVPCDWQAEQPKSTAEIEEVATILSDGTEFYTPVHWIAPDGSPCVMVDGLPRAGWWVG